MKKIRIEPKHSKNCSIKLFESPEAAYVWMNAKEDEKCEFGGDISLDGSKGEFVEIEWMGCEFVYDAELAGGHERFDAVHIAKVTPSTNPTQDLKDALISLYEGWTTRQHVQFHDGEGDDRVTTSLNGDVGSKVNIGNLFQKLHDHEETGKCAVRQE